MPIRPVFYVSDGTGITAETIGHSLLTQFGHVQFATDRIPFVDTPEKARVAVEEIRKAGEDHGTRPIVVNSCVDAELNRILADSGALMLDVFEPFIAPLEQELGAAREPRVGRAHGIADFDTYHRRIDAMNYALTHDDGISMDFADADLVLVGVSRAGKTPTCVYMALHYGIRDDRPGAAAADPAGAAAELALLGDGHLPARSGRSRGDARARGRAGAEHHACIHRGDRQSRAGGARHQPRDVLTRGET